MGFWQTVTQYFWREESLIVLVMALLLAFLLFSLRREDRKSILNTLIFFLVGLFLQFVSGVIYALQFTTA
ncbi:MAG: mechanosensitive ion channel protein MscS, partial [Gallionellales bacterium CG_4_10_14_3_um_filter_54_96]